jgi:hypothetical protein
MAVSTSEILSHLPRLRHFFAGAPKTLEIESASGADDLGIILGLVLGTTKAIGFWQWISQTLFRLGSRKTRVRSVVRSECEPIIKMLTNTNIPKAEPQPQPEVDEEDRSGKKKGKKVKLKKEKSPREHIKGIEKETKRCLKELRRKRPDLHRVGRVQELAGMHLARVAEIPEARFLNVNELGGVVRSRVMSRAEVAQQRARHAVLGVRRDADVSWSASMIREMRTQVNSAEDQVANSVDEDRGEIVWPEQQHVATGETRADGDGIGRMGHIDNESGEEGDNTHMHVCRCPLTLTS